jgi:hypothetical protein
MFAELGKMKKALANYQVKRGQLPEPSEPRDPLLVLIDQFIEELAGALNK